MSTETIIFLVLAAAVFFIVMFLLVGIAAFLLGRKMFQKQIARFLRPDPSDIQADLERLRRKYPNLSAEEVTSKYVGEQALFLAMVGFITQVWGFFVPFIGFTIDAGFTTLRQMRMVHVIGAIHGGSVYSDPQELEMRYMAMVGAGALLPRFALKLATGKIPIVGGVSNFAINWLVTQSIGKAAIGWNTGKTTKEIFTGEMRRLKDSAVNAKDLAVSKVRPNSQPMPVNAFENPGAYPGEPFQTQYYGSK